MAGLGNPGPAYEQTRHNAGFMLVEELARFLGLSFKRPLFKNYEYIRTEVGEHEFFFLKPLTYMNRSGDAVERFLWKSNLGWDSLLVAVDQMDLPLGQLRLKLKGGDAGHNGLKSLMAYAEGESFKRLYIGIGRPASGSLVTDHVLTPPEDHERAEMAQAVCRARDAVLSIPAIGWEKAMNEINQRT